jgi:hypothetical protein
LIRISRFIDVRHPTRARRLGGHGVAEEKKVVGGSPPFDPAGDVTRHGCPTFRRDRPHRLRLIAMRRIFPLRKTRCHAQRGTERCAIGLTHQASRQEQDKRPNDSENRIDRRREHHALIPRRVAARRWSKRKR